MGRAKRDRPGAVEFGKRIRFWREKREWSQMKFAELSGFHFTYISDVENGKRNVTLETILRLSKTLGVGPDLLVKGLEPDSAP
jgi:transcriptional regulator with XRE-family HTH domain